MAMAVAAKAAHQAHIAPPRPDKSPLKVNVFRAMQSANAKLAPLFPYFDEGAMVPASALFVAEPGADFGQFFHWNTQDELVVIFGSNNALSPTGQAYASARLHGVNAFLKDQTKTGSYLLAVIVQRQVAGDVEQREAIIYRCRKCSELLFRLDYDAAPVQPADLDDDEGDRFPAFVTQSGGAAAADAFNQTDRVCPKCGLANPPFPIDRWGCDRWMQQNRAVNEARRSLRRLASEQLAR